MNSIVNELHREFGFIDENLEPLTIPELSKNINAEAFHFHAKKVAAKIDKDSKLTTLQKLDIKLAVLGALREWNDSDEKDIDKIVGNSLTKIEEVVDGKN